MECLGNWSNVGRLLALTSVEDRRARVLKDPMFSPLILSQDARTTLVVVSTPEISNEVIGRLSLRGQEILQKLVGFTKTMETGTENKFWQKNGSKKVYQGKCQFQKGNIMAIYFGTKPIPLRIRIMKFIIRVAMAAIKYSFLKTSLLSSL